MVNILEFNKDRIKIRNFIHDLLSLVKGKSVIGFTFTDDDNIFDMGLCNSILLLILRSFIEKEFKVNVNIPYIDKIGDNTHGKITCSVNSILNFLNTRKEVMSKLTEKKNTQHHNLLVF